VKGVKPTEEEKLPYRIFDFAASLFAPKFSHSSLESYFCQQLDQHPSDLSIPDVNKKDKFKWLLGRLPVEDQRRVLDDLCRAEERPTKFSDRDQLVQMLGGSQVRLPAPLQSRRLDTKHISETWHKALERRHEDPDGAITAARTLLESVCKHILDECGVEYGDSADLPKLYGLTSKELNLAPSQHTEEAFKKILGGAHSVVDGLANLRNRLGDAHGQGKRTVKPVPRHAELAVNMAGSVALFLLATFESKH
jgi:hypothetical protein